MTPTLDDQLALLLEECLQAERARPGSSATIVDHAPPHLRPELERLLSLGLSMQASAPRLIEASRIPVERAAGLRARIMRHIQTA